MAHLTLDQRYKIEAYRNTGMSICKIADHVGKDKSVIFREIKRNVDQRSGLYKADLAERKAISRQKAKSKFSRFDANIEINVLYYLSMDYSPEQAAGRAKIDGLALVSAERIYQYVWLDKKKGGVLYKYLRTKGKKYRKRGQLNDKRGIIKERTDIDCRPDIVNDKQRIGDLEIDLVIGKGHKGALITINDRATGMLFMDKVESKEASVVEAKTIELLQDWKPLLKTVTSDNGKEFANHKMIADALDIDYYFAKPYHSWERGANENLNGLVRQYFPKKSDFCQITKEEINQTVNTLNNRPRKRFGFKTPIEIFIDKLDKST